MPIRANLKPVELLDNHDELSVVTLEHLERRLTEESGQIRIDIADLRADMIDRSASQLRWLLAFFVAQTTALAALLAVLR